jgi:hypothetical protein
MLGERFPEFMVTVGRGDEIEKRDGRRIQSGDDACAAG